MEPFNKYSILAAYCLLFSRNVSDFAHMFARLASLHNTYRELYRTKKELLEDADYKIGIKNGQMFADGTCWYGKPVKIKIEAI